MGKESTANLTPFITLKGFTVGEDNLIWFLPLSEVSYAQNSVALCSIDGIAAAETLGFRAQLVLGGDDASPSLFLPSQLVLCLLSAIDHL